MKRQCTDPDTYTNTAAVMFTDDGQLLLPDLPLNSSPPPQLILPDTHVPDPARIQPDPTFNNNNNNHCDGASIETQRRRRGRPPGSKNKPKSPNSKPTRLNQPDPNSLSNQPNHNNPNNQILEIPNGADVIQAIAKHAVVHNTSLRILKASGSVTDVTVRQQNNHHMNVTFGGRHDVVSLSAVFIHPSSFLSQPQLQNHPIDAMNDVTITMSCEKGQIGGGIVVGPLIACGSFHVLVKSISNLKYHRLDALPEINGNATDMVLSVPMYSDPSFMPY